MAGMKLEDMLLAIGIVLMGLGTFYIVWYPLYVLYSNPDAIWLFPYVVAVIVFVAGLVIVIRKRKGV